MEAKQLIESGSLELYVMQSLPPGEMREIDDMRKQNKEVNLEIYRIESALEEFAFAQSRQPKPELKEDIERRIGFGIELDLDMENVKSIIIHLTPVIRIATVAAVVFLAGLSITSYYFYNQYRHTTVELTTLKTREISLANEVNALRSSYAGIETQLEVVSDPSLKRVVLRGLPISATSTALIFWNEKTGAAHIKTTGLPAIAENQQYQLWAIVDGKPVNLGMLDKSSSFLEMKRVTNATAFAITLEPVGGNTTPTLEKMFVKGDV